MTTTSSVLALDVGERRIGVAIASVAAKIASPLKTLARQAFTLDDVRQLVKEHQAKAIVVGLPRSLNGDSTAQTRAVEFFGRELERALAIPLYWQDEAVTSRQAEAELEARGKPYRKEDIDALSAVYILEDFMRDNPEAMS